MRSAESKRLDMLHGPIWSKLPQFALPVAATAILEQLFNASDIAVVGNFTGADKTIAVAAVGANSALIALIVNLFIGIALGANVVIANAVGRGDREAVQKAVHTSIVFSLLGGIVAAFENGSVRGCTNRGAVLAGSKGQAGGIAATTWNGGNSRIESCRNGGVVKGMFGLAGSILGEGRTESDRVASCGVGGGVGTAAQGRDAAPKAAPENFDQFITGRNVVKNKAVVDRASCYYWDGNN